MGEGPGAQYATLAGHSQLDVVPLLADEKGERR
jgi:hypothetical protein